MSKIRSLIILQVIILTSTFATRANASEILSWKGTYSAIDGSTISGIKRLIVQSNTNSYISKWCIYLDGATLSDQQYKSDYQSPGDTNNPVNLLYLRTGSKAAPDQSSPGCWELPSTDSPNGIDIQVDTSTWVNGIHTFKIEATPFIGQVHSKTVTLNSTNDSPKVEWISLSDQTYSDRATLLVKLHPGGAPRITKACLLRDSKGVSSTDNITFEGDTDYGNVPSNLGPDGKFGSTPDGCAVFSDFQANDSPAGLHQVTTLSISAPITPWKDQPTTLELVVSDGAGRTFKAPINLKIENSKPTTSIARISGTSIRETVEFPMNLTRSGSPLSKICVTGIESTEKILKVKWSYLGESGEESPVNDCWQTPKVISSFEESSTGLRESNILEIKSYLLTNGAHSLNLIATDAAGRSSSTTHKFQIDNGMPGIAVASPAAGSVIRGWPQINATSSMSNTMTQIRNKTICVSLGTASSCSNTSEGVASSPFNTSCLPNGPVSVGASVEDTVGRKANSTLSITIRNGLPRVASLKVKSDSPKWTNKSTSGSVSIRGDFACSYKLEILEVNGKPVKKTSDMFTESNLSNATFDFRGLKPGKRYQTRITLTNSQGKSMKTIFFSTPRIPPRPPSIGSGGGGSGGGYGYTKFAGVNLEKYQDALGYDPATFDCSGQGRTNLWSKNWWIVGIRNGVFAISKSPSGCR